ncbi:SH3 domain-containing protein [Finegoldia sp. BIOML-A2]|uniref:SH3 domain-containing protein n=1 Tax=Finegoldia TaxID=150022 RepID=UPI000B91B478|nr:MULTISPECIES: SH3 domain-containing protein [Finegoldia]MDU5201309.1 SH3 domain-containing protein [Finegoldia magna]MDU5976909.1 SH3 domain-containing protein [Finegoldia magna]MDU6775799.1 SH3 domain-containing protein [Finegoldia magna]MSA96684.1 SH3 domain-containing protein [Finegoldia sp. BIOML-A5]MSB00069.1 SH3 domain-containing protein [Finegoldia sp. BIOML-A2]
MKQKNIIAVVLITVVIFVGTFVGLNIFNSSKTEKLDKLAHQCIVDGNYQKAVDYYSELYDRTNDGSYIDKKREAVELLSSKNNYDYGVNYLKEMKYVDAAKSFLKVSNKDSVNYQKAQQRLQESTQAVIIASDSFAEDDNFDASLNMLNSYARVMPHETIVIDKIKEVEKAKNQYNEKKQDEEKQRALSEKKEKEAREKAEKLANESAEELKKEKESTKKPDKKDESYETDDNKRLIDLCIRLVGKTYLVTADNAKIYEEPSNKSQVISSIPMGSEVYIYEAKPDSGQRVWCHAIIKSADSLKSYDAWISSNNLEIND